MAWGGSDVPLPYNGCIINTVDNTNNKDTVYDIDGNIISRGAKSLTTRCNRVFC